MTDYSIAGIVESEGESFTVSGVTRSYNARGDPTEQYTAYYLSGIVQVTDGSETEVTEGILDREDIIIFIDEDEDNASLIKNDDYITISTTTSGVFRIVSVVKNPGHYEVLAKRIQET